MVELVPLLKIQKTDFSARVCTSMAFLTQRVVVGVIFGVILTVALVIYGAFGAEAWFLLKLFGCQPGFLGSFSPQAQINVSYDPNTDELTVRHAGGNALGASTNTHSITIEITRPSSDTSVSYTWAEAGGTVPVESGDSVTIHSPTVGNTSFTDGDTIRVIVQGQWDQRPRYCPNRRTRATIAKTVVGEARQ